MKKASRTSLRNKLKQADRPIADLKLKKLQPAHWKGNSPDSTSAIWTIAGYPSLMLWKSNNGWTITNSKTGMRIVVDAPTRHFALDLLVDKMERNLINEEGRLASNG